ncbi:MAG: phosphoribosylformylglycinamidine synthase subunit PurQ, partial [Muribaculaceae bacterium]|nr:phosphoribosylformylglycinamidine synthase subunit PurQ [Muribaculaceae bacterium]
LAALEAANTGRHSSIYPVSSGVAGDAPEIGVVTMREYPRHEHTEHPMVYLPVFPGTNCDYDMLRAFNREGARTSTSVFRNLTPADVEESVREMVDYIDGCHILAFSGGFSAGDEPDGSGKFIASVIQNEHIKAAIERLLGRGGLVLGICNGFQALVKSGLLPFGRIGQLTPESPTLFRNDINRHISQIVYTEVSSVASPWLDGFTPGEIHAVAASHGEGKFTCSEEMAKKLADNGQIAFRYVDPQGTPTMTSPWNPNGSTYAIEGIISPDGQILGKMAHSERYTSGLMKNISGNKNQNIFANAVRYFRNNI